MESLLATNTHSQASGFDFGDSVEVYLHAGSNKRSMAARGRRSATAVAGSQLPKDPIALSDLQAYFSDDVNNLLQSAAVDALNSHSNRMNFGVVTLPSTSQPLNLEGDLWSEELQRSLVGGLNQSIWNGSLQITDKEDDSEKSGSNVVRPTIQNRGLGKRKITAAKTISKDLKKAPSQKKKTASRAPSSVSSSGDNKRKRPAVQSGSTSDDSDAQQSSTDGKDMENLSKRERNILACRKARKKKREKMELMEDKVQALEEKNKQLQKKLKVAAKKNRLLDVNSRDASTVRRERVQVLKRIYEGMNAGRLEDEVDSFHPTCVMIQPAQESIGTANMWRSWMEMGDRFASMRWEVQKMEPLDPRGNQFRCEWIFKGVLRPGAIMRHPYLKNVIEAGGCLVQPSEPLPTDGSLQDKYIKVESHGRSYYVFTPENQLVFCNHSYIPSATLLMDDDPTTTDQSIVTYVTADANRSV